jgi:hypothetical protein
MVPGFKQSWRDKHPYEQSALTSIGEVVEVQNGLIAPNVVELTIVNNHLIGVERHSGDSGQGSTISMSTVSSSLVPYVLIGLEGITGDR